LAYFLPALVVSFLQTQQKKKHVKPHLLLNHNVAILKVSSQQASDQHLKPSRPRLAKINSVGLETSLKTKSQDSMIIGMRR